MKQKIFTILLTLAVVAVALVLIVFVWQRRFSQPWTRDGQVMAQVVRIAPRVSAPIIRLAVTDNQRVSAGDILFELDPRTFQAALAQAEAQLTLASEEYQSLEQKVKAAEAQVLSSEASVRQARSSISQAEATLVYREADYRRQKNLIKDQATSRNTVEDSTMSYQVALQQKATAEAGLAGSEASLSEAQANLRAALANRGLEGEQNAKLRNARAALAEAQLNLEFTKVVAPVDGYVTNLSLRIGSSAVAYQPMLALVDLNSFWIQGFFKETQIARVAEGDPAQVTFMTYPDRPVDGVVESIGRGIYQSDGSAGQNLLPVVNPSFDWIRLAQRIPVRIRLKNPPADIELRMGATTSVGIHTRR